MRQRASDVGIRIARHADAAYEEAMATAWVKGVKIPMLK